VLAAVLGLASDTHTLARGEAMLVAYSLGLGVPFVALGVAFGRLAGSRRRARLMGPLAIACCALLVVIALRPGLAATLVILAASGACACFQVAANSGFVAAAPPGQRSQAFGLATAGMSLGQGAAMVAAGAAVPYFAPGTVIAAAGVAGAAAAITLSVTRPAAAGA